MLNIDGSLPVDGSGDFELVSKRGPPRGPRTGGGRREGEGMDGEGGVGGGGGVMGGGGVGSPSKVEGAPRRLMMPPPLGDGGEAVNGGGGGMLGAAGFWAMMGGGGGGAGVVGNGGAGGARAQMMRNGLNPPPPLIPVPGAAPLSLPLGEAYGSPTRSPAQQQHMCSLCGMVVEGRAQLTQHMIKVHAAENRDLLRVYGIAPESLVDDGGADSKVAALCGGGGGGGGGLMGGEGGEGAGGGGVTCGATPGQGDGMTSSDGSAACNNTQLMHYLSGGGGGSGADFGPGEGPPPRRREAPLDLTKPKEDGGGEDEKLGRGGEDEAAMIALPPRKRSRKGKAYKINLELQELESPPPDIVPPPGGDGGGIGGGASDESQPEYHEPPPPFVVAPLPVVSAPPPVPTMPTMPTMPTAFCVAEPAVAYAASLAASHQLVAPPMYGWPLMTPPRRSPHTAPVERPMADGGAWGAAAADYARPRSNSMGAQHRPPPPAGVGGARPLIDPAQAYSVGMSRRKLFMIQQMEMEIRGEQPEAVGGGGGTAGMIAPPLLALPPPEAKERPVMTAAAAAATVAPAAPPPPQAAPSTYRCAHCDLAFGDCIMYTMHMGYHGYSDPFKCNMCGYQSNDRVDFFLHIARVAHE